MLRRFRRFYLPEFPGRYQQQLKSKMAGLNTQSVDPVALVKEVITEFHNVTPIVKLLSPENYENIEADPDLIKVLMKNLIDNAVKFSKSDSDPVRVSIHFTADTFAFTVAENGQGSPEDKIDEIFEAFVKLNQARGHHQGYGLGLNLCQRIDCSSLIILQVQLIDLLVSRLNIHYHF